MLPYRLVPEKHKAQKLFYLLRLADGIRLSFGKFVTYALLVYAVRYKSYRYHNIMNPSVNARRFPFFRQSRKKI